jgi:hypothetical protein
MAEFVPGYHVARAIEHEAKDLERLILKAHASRAVAQFTSPAIELERRESKDLAVHRSLCRTCAGLRRVGRDVAVTSYQHVTPGHLLMH